MVDEISAALDEIEQTKGPLALVTTGAGKFFSNGFDLEWLAQSDYLQHRWLPLLGRFFAFPAVTVAAVNGHAFGAGAMFACAHDVQVMRAERGWWCMPEVDLGLFIRPPMVDVISARLPRATVHEALLTGRRYTGAEAVSAGIVHEAVPEAELLDRAVEIAAAGATKNREVIAWSKRLHSADVIESCLHATIEPHDVLVKRVRAVLDA
jgi:enoyl-CoA hydratase/carnithine racemase